MSIISALAGTLGSTSSGGGGGGGYLASAYGARPGWGNPSATGPSGVGSVGTPYDPGGNVSTVSGNPVTGALRRTSYSGAWINQGNYNSIDNAGVFAGAEQEVINDSRIAFQDDSTTENYCLQWKGYWKPSATGNWNFACNADDVVYVWLGSAALAPDITNYLVRGTDSWNANSVSVTGGQWYPIRIWFQEWGGGETMNVFAGLAGLQMQALYQNAVTSLAWNGSSDGY